MNMKRSTMTHPSPLLIALLSLFLTAQCSKAYSPSIMASSSHIRWSSSLSSTASAVDGSSSSSTSSHNNNNKQDGEDNEENITTRDLLSLDHIRSTLIRQEETIIFALIERAQFRQNDIVYKVGGVPGLGVPPGSSSDEKEDEFSFLDFMLSGTEALHSLVRRYESPEEHAFFPSRLPPRTNSLSELDYPNLLSNDEAINDLNWSQILYEKYLSVIVPAISAKGDDEQHGSTVISDIAALQALSKRIHYGKFVAESKYRSNPTGFQQLVDAGDAAGVMKLLTNEKVEEQVLTRARLKATTYGREPLMSSLPQVSDGDLDGTTAIIAAAAAQAVVAAVEAVRGGDFAANFKGKVDPAVIECIYRELIIPMTKDIEVAYLFLRCGREPPAEYASDRMSVDVTELAPSCIVNGYCQ
ncbi:hypothetical protein ACHAXR_004366 [Thalassiosira sp. AJA248-18]